MKRDSGIPNSLACFGSNIDNSISGSKKNRSQPVKWPPIAVLKIANPIISEPVSAMLSNNSSNVSITVFNKVQIWSAPLQQPKNLVNIGNILVSFQDMVTFKSYFIVKILCQSVSTVTTYTLLICKGGRQTFFGLHWYAQWHYCFGFWRMMLQLPNRIKIHTTKSQYIKLKF